MRKEILELLEKKKDGMREVCLTFFDGEKFEESANVLKENSGYVIYIKLNKKDKEILKMVTFSEMDMQEKVKGKEAVVLFDGERKLELEWLS